MPSKWFKHVTMSCQNIQDYYESSSVVRSQDKPANEMWGLKTISKRKTTRRTRSSETDPIMHWNDSRTEQHVDLLEEHQIHSGLNQRGGRPFHQEKSPTNPEIPLCYFPVQHRTSAEGDKVVQTPSHWKGTMAQENKCLQCLDINGKQLPFHNYGMMCMSGMVAIYKIITYTSKEKPRTCKNEIGTKNFSHPSPKLTIQIASVLQVSAKDRAVALTWRVTLNPKKLKKDILIAIAMLETKTVGVWIVWFQPRGRLKKGEDSAIEGMERMGNSIKIEIAPKRPSNPTATSGVTE